MSRMLLMNKNLQPQQLTTPDKILIIDDTAENISLLTEVLQCKGYQISAARDGERAIKIACHTIPDLILLDIMMPGIDGFETCRRLKNHELTKDIPVIFISAKTNMDDLVMGFSVGGIDYINKPFHKDEIYARIANQLKIRRLNNQLALSELNLRELNVEYQQQSEQLKQIVTLVVDGLLEVNSSGETQQANPAVEKFFGYSAKALHSINLSRLFAEPFAAQYNLLFSHNELESTKQGIFKEELNISSAQILGRRQDGSEFPIELSLKKIPSSKKMYLAIIHDITIYKDEEDKLRHLSYVDPLTNLSNRRYFDENYEKLWLQGHRNKSQIAFIMIDIDFFKQFNDTYGHQAGDDCLKKVAAALKEKIKRPCDIVARIGGEEFAIVLPDTSKEGVIQIVEQIKNTIQALKIPHSESNYGVITISLGLAITTVGVKCHSSSTLYQMADEALYQAKQSGRNRYSIL